jgi:hypothetical protein
LTAAYPRSQAGGLFALSRRVRTAPDPWGLKLYLITTPDGMPTAWCLADPKLGEREVAGDLLAHAAHAGKNHA